MKQMVAIISKVWYNQTAGKALQGQRRMEKRYRRYFMSKVAIISDSNSGIAQKKAKELGNHILPMPFFIDQETYY